MQPRAIYIRASQQVVRVSLVVDSNEPHATLLGLGGGAVVVRRQVLLAAWQLAQTHEHRVALDLPPRSPRD